MAQWLQALGHLIAPMVCRVCGRTLTADEEIMCLHCRLDFPRCHVHRDDFNIIHQRLGHSCRVDRAAGWFLYKKDSPYAKLLVDAKYASLPALARRLGHFCAQDLAGDGFFDGIDCVAPAPMHWLKYWKRGYNQSLEICRGISGVTALPVEQPLRAMRGHGVLSRTKRRDERFRAIDGSIVLREDCSVAGKHVLLVDDIITTGATMAECVAAVQRGSPSSVSVLALGLTNLDG